VGALYELAGQPDGERLRQILPMDPGYWEELERKERHQIVATAVEHIRCDRRLRKAPPFQFKSIAQYDGRIERQPRLEQYQATKSSMANSYPRFDSRDPSVFSTARLAKSRSGNRRTRLGVFRFLPDFSFPRPPAAGPSWRRGHVGGQIGPEIAPPRSVSQFTLPVSPSIRGGTLWRLPTRAAWPPKWRSDIQYSRRGAPPGRATIPPPAFKDFWEAAGAMAS
jgi:hypothetical protein